MEYVTEIINTIKNSPHPEFYYIAAAVGLIISIYMISKLLHVFMILLIIGVVVFGFMIFQGKDVNGIIASIQSSIGQGTGSVTGAATSAATAAAGVGTGASPPSTPSNDNLGNSVILGTKKPNNNNPITSGNSPLGNILPSNSQSTSTTNVQQLINNLLSKFTGGAGSK